jgi:hypothetical protein
MLYVLYLRDAAPGIPVSLKLNERLPNENELNNLYTVVRMFDEVGEKTPNEVLEKIFCEMQGEAWNPSDQKQEFLKSQGILHTSMSPGDLVYDDATHSLWACKSLGGWEQFVPTDLGSGQSIEDDALNQLLLAFQPIPELSVERLFPPEPTSFQKWLDSQDDDWVV